VNRHRGATAALAALLLVALVPATAAAHSELVTSDPAAGSTLAAPPVEIIGDFSESIDPARSTMELRGPDGAPIAKGGVPAGGPDTRMAITGLPALAPGRYEVRWTTVTADDNGVERGTFTFTVAEASSSAATVAPTPGPTSAAIVSPTPAPTAAPAGGAPSGGDLLIPLAVLVVVLAGGAIWLLRRRR
jgi:hypothetical protein